MTNGTSVHRTRIRAASSVALVPSWSKPSPPVFFDSNAI